MAQRVKWILRELEAARAEHEKVQQRQADGLPVQKFEPNRTEILKLTFLKTGVPEKDATLVCCLPSSPHTMVVQCACIQDANLRMQTLHANLRMHTLNANLCIHFACESAHALCMRICACVHPSGLRPPSRLSFPPRHPANCIFPFLLKSTLSFRRHPIGFWNSGHSAATRHGRSAHPQRSNHQPMPRLKPRECGVGGQRAAVPREAKRATQRTKRAAKLRKGVMRRFACTSAGSVRRCARYTPGYTVRPETGPPMRRCARFQQT